MFRANRFYGHRGILAEYAGVPTTLPIWGEVQHGWGYGLGGLDPTRSYPFFHKFLWGDRSLEAAAQRGLRRGVPVGAPFLYLARAMEARGRPDDRADGTLVYPLHSWEEQEVVGDHGAYAREIAEREERPTTVALYWLEYERPEVREVYERHGLRTVCHGRRYDPRFLYKQYAELVRHRRVVSNRVSTALWYAAALGLEIEVYGPVMAIEGSETADFAGIQKRVWPEVCGGGVSGDDATRIGARELGASYVREPDELRDVLGWSGPRAAIGKLLSARDGLLRRAILRSLLWDRWHPPPPYVPPPRAR